MSDNDDHDSEHGHFCQKTEDMRQMFDITRHRVCDALGIDRAHSWSSIESFCKQAAQIQLKVESDKIAEPIPMILICPGCLARHIDEGDFKTKSHHTHACQSCGFVWRPAIVPTIGVQFLPGFKND